MTGRFSLDWAILAVSLFNTILLLWLALTVFLNAERRVWGIWFTAGGLFLGSIFFISHSAILGHGLNPVTPGLNFWWRVGWVPVAALPFAWYVVMLWYSGFWDSRSSPASGDTGLYRRQRPWFALTLLSGLFLVGLLIFANPLPSFTRLAQYRPAAVLSIGGFPVLILVYPVYTLLCMGSSLDALRHPQPSGRLMGDLARRRARRWLIAASVVLLGVGFLVGWVILWLVGNAYRGVFSSELVVGIGWIDLLIDSLIALAVLLLGQAVVAYEVFTGKTLPRRGLSQYWRRAVILAAGYSLLVAWSVTIQLRSIYSLLLSAVLVVVFYALLGWRSYSERERLVIILRPFAASQNLYQNILESETAQADAQTEDSYTPFYALCANVLEVRQACLFAVGPLASLSGPPLVYPPGSPLALPPLDEITAGFKSPDELGLPLDPDRQAGMAFAVSLWSERGLIGLLLLGEKHTGGLYTQEEIEIARLTGERLIDARASAQMSRRLIALQRQRLVQSQVLDRRTRQSIHDEILPQVHTAILKLSANAGEFHADNGQAAALLDTADLLAVVHRQLSDLLRDMPPAVAPEVARLGLLGALRHTLEVEMQAAFDELAWRIPPEAAGELEALPPLAAEVLYLAAREAIRNAALHGRGGEGSVSLCLSIVLKVQDGLSVLIEDNGVGVSDPALSPTAGSGQGLALHSTLMAVIGGSLSLDSMPGSFTRVTLELPRSAWKSLASQPW